MDLGAYVQIDRFSEFMKKNNVEIPRLRGYRYMAEEQIVSESEIQKMIRGQHGWVCDRFVCSCPRFNPFSRTSEYSPTTDRLKKKYLIKETEECEFRGEKYTVDKTVGIRWDLIHGKRRKRLKYALKLAEKDVRRQFETFNKYVGRDDVFMIHARIGGWNWVNYDAHVNVATQPWFIEKVDDYFDRTYCDIYVKVDL